MIRVVAAILLICSVLSCKKNSAYIPGSLTGKWRMSGFELTGPTGETGWEPPHTSSSPYVIFPDNGPGTLFEPNDSATANQYLPTDASTMQAIYADGTQETVYYSVDRGRHPALLTITGDCKTFCGVRYNQEMP